MYTLALTLLIAVLVTSLADMYFVYSRDLMMLQQNSYRKERYMRWFNQANESTSFVRLFNLIIIFLLMLKRVPFEITAPIIVVIYVWQAVSLARKKYKKPLVRTPRVNRIFGVMLSLTAILAVGVFALAYTHLGLLKGLYWATVMIAVLLLVSPILLLLSNDILKPVEKHINQKFYDDAASILASMPSLKVIGITGSYGKTSTKHYLHRILSEHFSTTMTPGSYNTTLGVIRTVREYLKPYDEVFIVEMGAKQIGDIKEITDLVRPTIGIITAVGEQHLESFKTIENVQRTKFELVDALPADGFAVLNNDFQYVANRKVENVKAARYAVANPAEADYHAVDIKYSSHGTTFKVVGPGLSEPLELHTALVGECNVSNLLGAVIVALKLNVPAEKIKYAVSQIEQVEHRLSVKRVPGGLTIIDDAFNSNPAGSKMAVEVLGMMKDEGQRIIITPGMIELGARQQEANRQFGRYIAANADIAIVVGQYNRDAIMSGIAEGKMPEANVHAVDSFAEAQATLQRIARPGDIVLYENDLPDTFK
jgi:UDP-N-acetylmuramoyl-tripeptide--D-alanyl-D-alanine ligase